MLAISSSVLSGETDYFDEEYSICLSPTSSIESITCNKSKSIDFEHGGYGSFDVSFKTVDYDDDKKTLDYTVEFDNRTNCDVIVTSTMLRHGNNVSTLDMGTIDVESKQSRKSSVHTFYVSQRMEDAIKHLDFSLNGLAKCPD